jgi:hypothetical protein
MGGIAAGQSLLGTARDIGDQHRSRAELASAQESTDKNNAIKARLITLVDDKKTPATLRTAARTAQISSTKRVPSSRRRWLRAGTRTG